MARNRWFVTRITNGLLFTLGPALLDPQHLFVTGFTTQLLSHHNVFVTRLQRICYLTTTHWLSAPTRPFRVLTTCLLLTCTYSYLLTYTYLYLPATCTYLFLPALTCTYPYLPATCTYLHLLVLTPLLAPFFRKNKKFLTDPFQNTPYPSSNPPDPPPANHKKNFQGAPPLPVCPF